jgi:hypothetical protein
MKNEVKVMMLFLFITVCVWLSCMRAGAAVLRQINGEPVTASGQFVEFVGTNRFSGIGTPSSHQNDPTDTWMVMQVEGDYALVVKQNPIAVQTYGDRGAIYNQSHIKNTVEAWWGNFPEVQINGVPFREYVAPVRCEGADRSNSFGYNLAEQSCYRTVVDPNGVRVAFVPSLIDVCSRVNGALDVGKDNWQRFAAVDLATTLSAGGDRLDQIMGLASAFVGSVGRALNQMWLRSPLNSPFSVAAIGNDGGISSNNGTSISNLTLRPACWVRVKEPVPPRLMQKDGQPVSECGQIVEFIGTSGFGGVNTPPEHQADLLDDYMVMQIEERPEGRQALIMKKNPIAVQKYKEGGTEARYDQSDIKVSVETWYRGLPPTRINGVPFRDYVLPVFLHGASQSAPFGYNFADQSNYRSVVDLQRGEKQAFVPSLIDVVSREFTLYAGRDNWRQLVFDFSAYNKAVYCLTVSWLRSPSFENSGSFIAVGIIDGNGACGSYVGCYSYSEGIRPAYWVRI